MWFLLAACGTGESVAPEESTRSVMVREVPPAIDAQLIEWLDAQPSGRRFQLPIRVKRRGLGVLTHIEDGGDGIPVTIDSSRLSMMLEDAVRLQGAEPSIYWLEGTWGSAMGTASADATFAVDRVVEPVDGPVSTIRFVR